VPVPAFLLDDTSRRQMMSMKNNDPVQVKEQLFFTSKSVIIQKFTTENSPQIHRFLSPAA
jgi:hypothetical protein